MKSIKPLKIAFVTNNYTPYSGGVVSSIKSFAHELERQGHEVLIITLDFKRTAEPDTCTVVRVPCYGHFTYKGNPMAIPYRPTRHLRTMLARFKPDIIHSQHPFLLGASAIKVARQLSVPVVFTYHTVYEDYVHYIPYIPEFISRRAVQRLVTRYCNKVRLIITPSRAIQMQLEQNNVAVEKRLIRSGLQSVFVNERQPEKKSSTKATCALLVVSRFVPEKNIQAMIDLFLLLEQQSPGRFSLTLIGFGPEFDAIRSYAYDRVGLPPERVIFIYKPDKKYIAQAYKEADIFLFSSLTDVQPLALVEALAGATPIVALAGSGRAVIEHGYNGFIADTLESMAEHILRIADDDALRSTLQAQAFATSQQFMPAVTTAQLLQAYASAMTSAQGGNATSVAAMSPDQDL